MKVLEDFNGELGQAAVLIDGYIVNVSGRPAVSTADPEMFVTRTFSATSGVVGEPIEVRLRFGSAAGADYYVAVEDTLPPGFEADGESLQANVRGEVQSFCLRGDKLAFFVNSLSAPMELSYRVIPTISGAVVAPPARLFPMYASERSVFSCSAELTILERDGSLVDGSGGYAAGKAPGAAPAERQEPVLAEKNAAAAARPGAIDEEAVEEGAPLPDLWVGSVNMMGVAAPGQAVVFIAEVRLSGFSSDIPLTVYAYVDGRQVKTESLWLSSTMETFSINIDWTAVPGPHLVRVSADPLGWVDEIDENNNAMEVSFYVQRVVTPQRQSASPWQWGLLGLDALVCAVLTVKLYGPATRWIQRRRTKGTEVRTEPPDKSA